MNCKPYATIQPNGACKCLEGFEEFDQSCAESSKKIEISLKALQPGLLLLQFSNALPYRITKADLELEIRGQNVDFELGLLSFGLYTLKIEPDQGVAYVAVKRPLSFIPGSDLWFFNVEAYTPLIPVQEPGDRERTWLDDITDWLPLGLKLLVGVLVFLQMSFGGFAWHLIGLLQMLSYVPTMDLGLPSDLDDFFEALNLYNCIPNVPVFFTNSLNPFLQQTGRWATTLATSVVVWGFLRAMSCNCAGKFSRLCGKIASSFEWSFFVRIGLMSVLDLSFVSLSQLKRLSYADVSSVLCSCSAALYMVSHRQVLLGTALVVLCIYTALSDKNDPETLRNWGTLYQEFKPSLSAAAFNLAFVVRRVTFAILLSQFDFSATMWAVLNGAHSSAVTATQVLAYLLISKPFKYSPHNLLSPIAEVCLAGVFALASLNTLLSTTVVRVAAVALVFSILAVGVVASCAFLLSKLSRGQQVMPMESVDEQLDEDYRLYPHFISGRAVVL
jgi:hypothetical protein